MSRWTRGMLSVLVAGLLIACFFGVLAFLVFGFSPDSPVPPGDTIIPLIASASGMVLLGAALWALGRRSGKGDRD